MTKNQFILCFTVFFHMIGFSIIFPIFPKLVSEFLIYQKNDTLTQWILYVIRHIFELQNQEPLLFVAFGGLIASIYSMLQFVFAPIWGKVSDFLGRKPIFLITSVGNMVGYFIWIISSNFTLFAFSRMITGIMGGCISVSSASMADSTNEKDRSKGMGLIGASIGLGFIVGPTFGGILSSYNPDFLMNKNLALFPLISIFAFLISILDFLLIFFFYKETCQKKKKKKIVHPFLEIFSSILSKVLILSVLYFLVTFSFSGFEFSINFYLNEFLKFNTLEIGYTFLYIGIIIIVVQGGIIRRISGKVEEKLIALVGGFISIIGYFILIFFPSLFTFFLAISFLALGQGLLNPSLAAWVSIISHQNEQGKNLGIFRSLGSLARGLSPLFFAMIYFRNDGKTSFIFALLIYILFFIFLIFVRDKKNLVEGVE